MNYPHSESSSDDDYTMPGTFIFPYSVDNKYDKNLVDDKYELISDTIPSFYGTPGDFPQELYLGKGHYKAKSKKRRLKEYYKPEFSKLPYWLSYMIDTGAFGVEKVCNAITTLEYNIETMNFALGEHSLFYSIVECPYSVVVIDVYVFDKTSAHANLLLVNKKTSPWEIERFEPHGNFNKTRNDGILNEMSDKFDIVMEEWLALNLKPYHADYVYKKPIDVCPLLGPQSRSEEVSPLNGFCQTWTYFYLDARLSNPEMTGTDVLKELYTYEPTDLFEMIQDYVLYVRETQVPESYIKYRKILKESSVFIDFVYKRVKRSSKLSTINLNRWVRTIYSWVANSKTYDEVDAILTFCSYYMDKIDDSNIEKVLKLGYIIAEKKIEKHKLEQIQNNSIFLNGPEEINYIYNILNVSSST